MFKDQVSGMVRMKIRRPEPDQKFFICPECGSDDKLIKWDEIGKPCPVCNGSMEPDGSGMSVLWD
jgi:rubrerythrin